MYAFATTCDIHTWYIPLYHHQQPPPTTTTRLQVLEQEGPPAHPHIVTAEIHPQGREPLRMGQYQPAQTEPDVVTFVNPMYHAHRTAEAPPTSAGRPFPPAHSLEHDPPSLEERPSSVHFADQFYYPTLKEEKGGKADRPCPRPRERTLPSHVPPRVHDGPTVAKEMLHREFVNRVDDRGTPRDYLGGGTTVPLSPGYSSQEDYTQVRHQSNYSSYARVLPPPTTRSEELEQIISELVAQKE